VADVGIFVLGVLVTGVATIASVIIGRSEARELAEREQELDLPPGRSRLG